MEHVDSSPHDHVEVTDDPKKVKEVRDIMADIEVAMLTTIDSTSAEGRLTSRPLTTQIAEPDGDALFLVRRSSAVAKDVEVDPRVNVAYTSRKAWVSLAGRAEIITDRGEVERLWSKGAAMFMDGGPENPDNVVLKVHGDTAELWGGDSMVATVVKTVRSMTGDGDENSATVVDLP